MNPTIKFEDIWNEADAFILPDVTSEFPNKTDKVCLLMTVRDVEAVQWCLRFAVMNG